MHNEAAQYPAIHGSESFVVTNHLGNIIKYDSMDKKIFGFPRNEVINRNITNLLSMNSNIVIQTILAKKKFSKISKLLVEAKKKDNTLVTLEVSINSLILKEKFYIYSFRFPAQIEQSRIDTLMPSKILESSSDAIIGKTLEGTIQFWNPAAEKLFGYKAQEVRNKHISVIIPAARLQEEIQLISRLKKIQYIKHFETIRLTKNGKEISVSLALSVIKNQKGRIIGASSIIRNLNQQDETAKQFKMLANMLPQLVWITDKNGGVYWCNDQWFKYTGTQLKDVEGWGWQSVHDPQTLPIVLKKWKLSISTGKPI